MGVNDGSLVGGNGGYARLGIHRVQWFESEFGTAGGQRFNDSGYVVANQTESGDFRVCFHCATQRRLHIRIDIKYDSVKYVIV